MSDVSCRHIFHLSYLAAQMPGGTQSYSNHYDRGLMPQQPGVVTHLWLFSQEIHYHYKAVIYEDQKDPNPSELTPVMLGGERNERGTQKIGPLQGGRTRREKAQSDLLLFDAYLPSSLWDTEPDHSSRLLPDDSFQDSKHSPLEIHYLKFGNVESGYSPPDYRYLFQFREHSGTALYERLMLDAEGHHRIFMGEKASALGFLTSEREAEWEAEEERELQSLLGTRASRETEQHPLPPKRSQRERRRGQTQEAQTLKNPEEPSRTTEPFSLFAVRFCNSKTPSQQTGTHAPRVTDMPATGFLLAWFLLGTQVALDRTGDLFRVFPVRMKSECLGDEGLDFVCRLGENHSDSRESWDLKLERRPWTSALMENNTYRRPLAPGLLLLNTHRLVSHLTVKIPEVIFKLNRCGVLEFTSTSLPLEDIYISLEEVEDQSRGYIENQELHGIMRVGRCRPVPGGCEGADLWRGAPEVAGASCDNLVLWENGLYPESPREWDVPVSSKNGIFALVALQWLGMAAASKGISERDVHPGHTCGSWHNSNIGLAAQMASQGPVAFCMPRALLPAWVSAMWTPSALLLSSMSPPLDEQ
ncbi:hypothetical protein DNTS_025150, partial [Danionella cerebrum]